eukprot:TRINITY_DN3227_c0_g1_i2.p1 TRINITY_DN3227_c0_g1~~TRINITY_DN3227_c0_g1_i2.p1  ORF type:complete len:360 (+),score=50.42 TRINITY_DN3227_c0_g1_i2:42-1121(+)
MGLATAVIVILCILGAGLCYSFYTLWNRLCNLGQRQRMWRWTRWTPRYIDEVRSRQPVSSFSDDVLDQPLRNFYISSSHNTYVAAHQNLDCGRVEMYEHALRMGARVVECDVFARKKRKQDFEPEIAHGVERGSDKIDIYTVTPVPFEEAIKRIAELAFENTNDPLILTLELNTNNIEQSNDRIVEIVKQHFGDRLFVRPNGATRDWHVANVPIRQLLGRVILLAGGGHTGELSNILAGYPPSCHNCSHGGNIDPKTGLPTAELAETARHKLTRVYPSGTLLGHFSCNFDPKPFWDKGCQIVALNFHTNGSSMQKNLEMFRNCSFVLKPEHLRGPPATPLPELHWAEPAKSSRDVRWAN